KFSELQLRSVLRLEVEVVRFLKEEPHKMDLMLKRVKALTEALSALRRCVSDSAPTTTSAQVGSLKTLETDQGPSKIRSPQSSPKPHPRSSVRPPVPSLSQDEVGPAGSASPILFRRMKSGAATMIQPSHHHPNPPLTPTHGRDSPSAAKVSPCNREGSPGLQKTVAPLQSDQLGSSAGGSSQPAQTPALESHTDQNPNTHTHTEVCVVCAAASVEQQPPLSDTQEDIPLKLRDEVDSGQLKSQDTGPSQHPAATVEPPLTAPPSALPNAECTSGPQVEKPCCCTVDKEVKQSPDMEQHTSKSSPPPPPPRRFHTVSSGLTTGRSGEVIFTTRKEQVGAQDEREKEKEPSVVPQPKPTRQPPEVKPKPKAKPQMCPPALAGFRSTPATASAHRNKEEEEQDNKFMKELQTSSSSSSSSAQHLRTESHHSSSSCSPEKTPQGHKQSSQVSLPVLYVRRLEVGVIR
ncbi:Sickle tail protein, partial [Larimichthys crocea]